MCLISILLEVFNQFFYHLQLTLLSNDLGSLGLILELLDLGFTLRDFTQDLGLGFELDDSFRNLFTLFSEPTQLLLL